MIQQQYSLFLPDRFDILSRRAPSQLSSIIVPVKSALSEIINIHEDMRSAGRGAFLILRGDSGCGKSTFLNTLGLFLEDVEVVAITANQSIEAALNDVKQTTKSLRVVIIEGRDALKEVSANIIESAIHAINTFIRSASGEKTLVVWSANVDDLTELLENTAKRIGADALIGVGQRAYRFSGPPRGQYIEIANRTIATLNQGATLSTFGISEERALELCEQANTVGNFLGLLRKDLLKNEKNVNKLLEKEQCKLWIVVLAGNDPEGDISGLTRGTNSSIDIERLLGATNANIVRELKKFPDKLGILGAVLDAKILHFPSIAALAIARDFASAKLKKIMAEQSLSTTPTNDGLGRLNNSALAKAFTSAALGTRPTGPLPGSNTKDAFIKLAKIASTNDSLLNTTLGDALVKAELIESFDVEQDFGSGLKRRTDILCKTKNLGTIRIEVMWRAKTGRAEIANYSLNKLDNYGKAIGFLE